MNNFILGTPEHAALERLKTMRLIGSTGLMDDVVSDIITEVGEAFRSWATVQQKQAVEEATEVALEGAHAEFENGMKVLIDGYDRAFSVKLDELKGMHQRALSAMHAIRRGDYNIDSIDTPAKPTIVMPDMSAVKL